MPLPLQLWEHMDRVIALPWRDASSHQWPQGQVSGARGSKKKSLARCNKAITVGQGRPRGASGYYLDRGLLCLFSKKARGGMQ